jgi:hypothetical protein
LRRYTFEAIRLTDARRFADLPIAHPERRRRSRRIRPLIITGATINTNNSTITGGTGGAGGHGGNATDGLAFGQPLPQCTANVADGS